MPQCIPRRDRSRHLLIVQNVVAPLVAVISLCTLLENQDAVGFAAALLTNPVQFGPTRDLLQLARLCLARHCRLQTHVWQPDEAFFLQVGSGLTFLAGYPNERVGDENVLEPIDHAVILAPDQPLVPAQLPLASGGRLFFVFCLVWFI